MNVLPATVTDAELACAAAAGDRHAFACIYDRYADRLFNFCIGMLADRDAAADCVQEVFCTAAAGLRQLHEPDKLRPWLYGIARPLITRQIVTAQTTAAAPPPAPSVTSSSPPTTTPATSVRSVTPPTTSIAHHGGGGSGPRAVTGPAIHG
jgi:DNA-directed RNA polymerase specialized sigma24 family protein